MKNRRWSGKSLKMMTVLASILLIYAIPAEAADADVDRLIEIIAEDYDFNPSHITVRPDQKIQVTLVNRGSAPHNIEFHLAGDQEAELENPVAPGEQASLTFTTPSKTGEYVYYCPIGNHRELGMKGTMEVQP